MFKWQYVCNRKLKLYQGISFITAHFAYFSTHTHTHARTHARKHARTHARTHAHTHQKEKKRDGTLFCVVGTVSSFRVI